MCLDGIPAKQGILRDPNVCCKIVRNIVFCTELQSVTEGRYKSTQKPRKKDIQKLLIFGTGSGQLL